MLLKHHLDARLVRLHTAIMVYYLKFLMIDIVNT
jgi:hypothetical protein